jgi:hypothetical protein
MVAKDSNVSRSFFPRTILIFINSHPKALNLNQCYSFFFLQIVNSSLYEFQSLEIFSYPKDSPLSISLVLFPASAALVIFWILINYCRLIFAHANHVDYPVFLVN